VCMKRILLDGNYSIAGGPGTDCVG
jgi:hypothetical protein